MGMYIITFQHLFKIPRLKVWREDSGSVHIVLNTRNHLLLNATHMPV